MGRCHRNERTSLSLLLTGFVYTVVSKYCVHGLAKKKKVLCACTNMHTRWLCLHIWDVCVCVQPDHLLSAMALFF